MTGPRLSGKVAIVSGATQGLGADIARALALAGVERVFVVGLGHEAGAAVVASIGPQAELLEADITDDAAIDRCIERAAAVTGRIDVLVNGACSYADAGLDTSRAQWLQTLNVNLVSAAIFTQKAVPHMPPGAVVIHLGSVGGKFGMQGRAAYPASKAGLLQITKNFAVTLAPRGIRVLSVSPAWTWSPAVERAVGGDLAAADAAGAVTHPLGRIGRGAEVGRVVVFAASDDAAWMTGTDLAVDGGFACLGPDQGLSAGPWFERALRGTAPPGV